MAIYELDGKRPRLGANSYVDPSASVIGDVVIGDGVYIAPGAVLRGDFGPIVIGDGTNIQDHCLCHGEVDAPVVIGKRNHVGHRAIIHCATVGDACLIGMGCIILDGAVVEDRCIIAAGALVTKGSRVPSGSLLMGMPGKVVGKASEAQLLEVQRGASHYQGLVERYASLKRLD
ncbi:MAG: gamma carbonic anhydrase family protein [Candidatus Tectomicrobia bacterium]|nr:gamma carbonic anhydrase family protein [Candidatus Tectomicrobia bacterium]